VAKAATLRSAPAIEVAMLRSGRVLQRSKNRFDSPMAQFHASFWLKKPLAKGAEANEHQAELL
jgi:hypothetical protein